MSDPGYDNEPYPEQKEPQNDREWFSAEAKKVKQLEAERTEMLQEIVAAAREIVRMQAVFDAACKYVSTRDEPDWILLNACVHDVRRKGGE